MPSVMVLYDNVFTINGDGGGGVGEGCGRPIPPYFAPFGYDCCLNVMQLRNSGSGLFAAGMYFCTCVLGTNLEQSGMASAMTSVWLQKLSHTSSKSRGARRWVQVALENAQLDMLSS